MNSKQLVSTQSSLAPSTSVYCLSSKEILSTLKRLYLHYSTQSNKIISSLLTNVRLVKLLQDSNVIDNRFTKQEIEIIVSREAGRRTCISFDMFCEVLARLAKEKYRKEYSEISPTDALFCLMNNHLYPLYLQLEHDKNIEHFENIDQNIDQSCIKVLNSCISVLNILYEKYFPWEITSPLNYAQILNNSEHSIILFLQKFDLTPACLNYKMVAKIWQDIEVVDTLPEILNQIKGKDRGKVFSFKKFVLFLIRCAFLSTAPWEYPLSSDQKVASLLGRLEHSAGFKEVEKEYMRVHNYRLKLIPLHTKTEMLYTMTTEIKETSTIKTRESLSSDLSLSINFEAYSKIDPHIDTVEHIFRAYCNYGDRDYAQKLSLNQYLKLLYDAQVIQNTASVLPIHAEGHIEHPDQPLLYKLARAEAELIFAQVAGKRRRMSMDPNGFLQVMNKEMEAKIDFNQFLKSLEMISSRVFVECNADTGLPYMIEYYILKLDIGFTNTSLDQIMCELEVLRKDEHQEIMNALSYVLPHYGKIYQVSSGIVNFEGFSNFLRDFEIFPSIVSKSKSVHIYYILSREYKKSKGITSSNIISTAQTITMLSEIDKDVIDFSLFVEGIGLCAMHINIQYSSIEAKIVSMIQKIIYSKGAAIVSAQTGVPRNNLWENAIMLKFINVHKSIKAPSHVTFFDMIKEKPKKADTFCK